MDLAAVDRAGHSELVTLRQKLTGIALNLLQVLGAVVFVQSCGRAVLLNVQAYNEWPSYVSAETTFGLFCPVCICKGPQTSGAGTPQWPVHYRGGVNQNIVLLSW